MVICWRRRHESPESVPTREPSSERCGKWYSAQKPGRSWTWLVPGCGRAIYRRCGKTKRSTERSPVVLVDTSVGIDVFRKPSTIRLESLVEFDDIVTCLPVVQEVLQGFDSEPAFTRARDAMLALPIVECPLGVDVFEQAIDLYRSARRLGLTIRSSVDCL